jgi:predicted aspartyl protease
MKERKNSKILACVAALFACFFAITSLQPVFASTVKFRSFRGHMVVIPVTVRGPGPNDLSSCDFLLDTGTSTTLISAEFARALRLRVTDQVELMTVAGARFLPRAALANVTVGTKSASAVEVVIADLKEARAVSPEIRGVLGQNFLSRFNFLINYRDRQLEFEEGNELEGALTGERLPFEWREGQMMVLAPAMSVGQRNWRFVLDSGCAGLLFFADDWRALKLDWERCDLQRGQARSEVGSQALWQGRLRRFSVGDVEFSGLPVRVMGVGNLRTARIEDGLLPTSLFQQVYVNQRRRFVILNPKFGLSRGRE